MGRGQRVTARGFAELPDQGNPTYDRYAAFARKNQGPATIAGTCMSDDFVRTVKIWDLEIHLYSGLTILTLVLFRIVWGFFGSESARFQSFVRRPKRVFAYLRK